MFLVTVHFLVFVVVVSRVNQIIQLDIATRNHVGPTNNILTVLQQTNTNSLNVKFLDETNESILKSHEGAFTVTNMLRLAHY